MLLRLAIAVAVVAAVAALAWLWRRPPRTLRVRELSALGIDEPAVVQFSSRYCLPCAAATPKLRAAAAEAGIRYEQVDVGQRPDVARSLGIRTVPTIAITARGGRVVDVWTTVPDAANLAEAIRRASRPPLRV